MGIDTAGEQGRHEGPHATTAIEHGANGAGCSDLGGQGLCIGETGGAPAILTLPVFAVHRLIISRGHELWP